MTHPETSGESGELVKRLEWCETITLGELRGGSHSYAGSILGTYKVWGDGSWSDPHNFHVTYPNWSPEFLTIDAAKASAQKHYNAAILSAIDATAIERLTAERDEARARVSSGSDYSIQLQRIIEAVCHGNELREDSAELFHHKMVLSLFPDYREVRSALLTAETNLARGREALTEAQHELWNLGLVIGQIAKWPRTYFHRAYIEEWVIRTARIIERWNGPKNAIDVLNVTSGYTKPNKRLAAEAEAFRARSALGDLHDQ